MPKATVVVVNLAFFIAVFAVFGRQYLSSFTRTSVSTLGVYESRLRTRDIIEQRFAILPTYVSPENLQEYLSCIIFSMINIRRTGSCSRQGKEFLFLFLFFCGKNNNVLGYSLGENKCMVGTCVMLCRCPKHMFLLILSYSD